MFGLSSWFSCYCHVNEKYLSICCVEKTMHTYIYTPVYIYTHIFIAICMHSHKHAHMLTYVRIHIHTYRHICTYVHTHTYIRIYVQLYGFLWLSPPLRDACGSSHHWSGIFSSFSVVYFQISLPVNRHLKPSHRSWLVG